MSKSCPNLDWTEFGGHHLAHRQPNPLEGMTPGRHRVDSLFSAALRGAPAGRSPTPFSLLWAFVLMRYTNIPANLLSFGAIDFGAIR